MAASGSNRALRALVAELADLGDIDLESILADLEPGERSHLLELMAEYRTGEARPDAETGRAPELSPWLNDRLTAPAPPGVTPEATDALRQAAADRGWRSASPGRAARPARRPWLGGPL